MESEIFRRIVTCYLVFLAACTIAVKLPQNPNPKPLAWWQEEVVYQVYPRSHQDSDGDGIGDLKGIQSRLDHFVELGVGSVWISPIYKSPMKDFGYDVSNFTDIEPTFGTLEDFKELSAKMKEKGIRLIMDFVPNHTSDLHDWFNKSVQRIEPYTNYYVWKDPSGFDEQDKPIPPNNWVNLFVGSMWEWNEQRSHEILAVMKVWLDYGVDGFRVDAVPHLFEDQTFPNEAINPNRPPDSLPTDYFYWEHKYTYNLPQCLDALAELRRLLDVYSLADGKERVLMVESTVAAPELFDYYGTPDKPIAHFPFNFQVIGIPRGYNASHIESVVSVWYDNIPAGAWANWLSGNHDNIRVATRYGPEAIDTFNMLMLLLPGSAVTYYGEEIGMSNANISWEDTVDPFGCNAGADRYHLFSRDPERTPMQWNDEKNAGFSTGEKTWLPMHPDFVDVNVAAESLTSQDSHLKIYKKLVQLRKTDIWRYGSLESKSLKSDDVFGFARIFDGKGFLVLTNTANEQIVVDAVEEFEGVPGTGTVYVISVGFTPEISAGSPINLDSVTVGGKHAIVIEF